MLNASVYATRGGLRAVWAIKSPPPLKYAQSWLDDFHATMIPPGLPVSLDRGVKDWTRGFRVPHCPRHDNKVAPWRLGMAPADLRRLSDGEKLDWHPRLEQEERQFSLRRVVWPVAVPGQEGREVKRIRALAHWWARRIAAASSRHAEILSAGRQIGGMCAYYGVNPDEFVEIISGASSSDNASKTARTAVDYGAHEPIPLPDAGEVAASSFDSRIESAFRRIT
jgi:hypothetical protein